MMAGRRWLLAIAGLLGAAGVALSALASHIGDTRLLGNAATICLAHGPALLALFAGYERIRTALAAGLLIGLGSLLFTLDLVSRSQLGQGLFPMSAPLGGMAMILGWLAVLIGAFLPARH